MMLCFLSFQLHLSIYWYTHTHTPASPSLLLYLRYDRHKDLDAVGSCSRSLHCGAFSSSSTSILVFPQLVWIIHIRAITGNPPTLYSPSSPPPLKTHQDETGGLWGLWGHISWIFTTVKCKCLSSSTVDLLTEMNHSQLHFWGELLKASLLGPSAPLIWTISGFHAKVGMTRSQHSWIW